MSMNYCYTLNKNRKNYDAIVYILFAVYYFWFAAQIPYGNDDWEWGIDIGIQQFLHATLNSRYVGNFFEIVMTRSVVLKVFIMGSCFFLIPSILSQFAAKSLCLKHDDLQAILFVICNGLLLTANQVTWRQTYGWVAGFANFTLSAAFMMIWIYELLHITDADLHVENGSKFTNAVLFVLSVCCQLFIENLSVYCTLLGIYICGVYYVKFKKIPLKNLVMLIGSVIGLIIMFSSSLYDTLLSDGTAVYGYREIPFLSSLNVKEALYETALNIGALGLRMYSVHTSLSLTVLALFSYFLIDKRNLAGNPHSKKWLFVNFILAGCFAVCHILLNILERSTLPYYFLGFMVSLAYFCTITREIQFIKQKEIRKKLYSLWFSAVAVIVPLVVTTTHSARLFFTSNIFVILFVLLFWGHIADGMSFTEIKKLKRVSFCAVAIILCAYSYIFASIGQCMRERDAIINAAVQSGTTEVELPAYPFRNYLYKPDPTHEISEQQFKEFNGLPSDTKIIIID